MPNLARTASALLSICFLASPATSLAAGTPAQKCENLKLREAGRYGACRLTVVAKSLISGDPVDFAKCGARISDKWQTAEDKAEGACPTNGDASSIFDVITGHTDLLTLLLSGASDDPDAAYVDAAGGTDDAGCGPRVTPCATIGFGLAQALADGKLRVYVSDDAYFEDVSLIAGIDLLGGYDAGSWSPSSNRTVLYGSGGSGHRAAMSAVSIASATSVSGFVIHGASASTAGANSYAVYVSNSSGLSLTGNVIYAGSGGPGADAAPASDGGDGVDGEGRSANPAGYDAFIATGVGACNASNNRQLGNGGSLTCGVTNVSGGNGGGNSCPASSTLTELSADDGFTASAGGAGGDGGDDSRLESGGSLCVVPAAPTVGAQGSDGPDGAAGSSGPGCAATAGMVIGGNWIPSSGGSGGSGASGRGGGGGGGGGGGYCLSCAESKDRLGAHGGGGGSGGCGASGGGGGGGGGGSFGLFVSGGSAPVFTGNAIYRGSGGSGGRGARSGHGGVGGSGGEGGTSSVFCANAAGSGGDGGNGGSGGGGGGGCGGSVFGIYTAGVGSPTYCDPGDANVISSGSAGAGGQGGPSLVNNGSDGSSGLLVGCSFN